MSDPRDVLMDQKLYIHIPLPLFEHLCTLDLEASDWKIFLLHWHEGCLGRAELRWLSRLAISTVAKRTCLSVSTVKRSYKKLVGLGFIIRRDMGRNADNPMRKNIVETEITIPAGIASDLVQTGPNRYKTGKRPSTQDQASNSPKTKSEPQKKSAGPGFVSPSGPSRIIYPGAAYKVLQAIFEHFPGDEETAQKTWEEVMWKLEAVANAETDAKSAKRQIATHRQFALTLIKAKKWQRPSGMPDDWKW